MYIHNKRMHLIPLGAVKLIPGDNHLTQKQADSLKPYITGMKSMMKAGWISVEDRPIEAEKTTDPTEQLDALFGAKPVSKPENPTTAKPSADDILNGK